VPHQFGLESVKQCYEEIIPVLRHEHWEEVGHYKDIPIDMQWDKYFTLQEMGKLRCFTIRGPVNEEFKTQELFGYAFYIVDYHLHYKNTKVGGQDILYIRKPHRGIGQSFIDYCDKELAKEGVTTVTQHIKPWFDWSPMAERLGYEKAETIWTRRLDKEGPSERRE